MNPNPKDTEIRSKMLKEFDKDEMDEDFKLYFSDDEKFDNISLEDDLLDGNTDPILFTRRTM